MGPYLFRGVLGILCIVGVVVLVSIAGAKARSESQTGNTPGELRGKAFLSNYEQSYTWDLHKGEATCVMGHVDLDLRKSEMKGDEAVLDVTVLMGAMELRIPETWTVVRHDLDTVMGRTEDSTRHPSAEEGKKRLVIKGVVIMGSLDIRN